MGSPELANGNILLRAIRPEVPGCSRWHFKERISVYNFDAVPYVE